MPGYNTEIHYQMISAVDYKTLRSTLGIRGQNVLRELKRKRRRDSEPNNSKPQSNIECAEFSQTAQFRMFEGLGFVISVGLSPRSSSCSALALPASVGERSAQGVSGKDCPEVGASIWKRKRCCKFLA